MWRLLRVIVNLIGGQLNSSLALIKATSGGPTRVGWFWSRFGAPEVAFIKAIDEFMRIELAPEDEEEEILPPVPVLPAVPAPVIYQPPPNNRYIGYNSYNRQYVQPRYNFIG